MAYLVKKGKRYHAIFSFKGKKKWISLGNVSKQDANKLLKKLQAEYKTEELFNMKSGISLATLIDKYLIYSKNNKSHSSYRNDKRILALFIDIINNRNITSITSELIEKYKQSRNGRNIKPSSLNRELASIRAMLNQAKEYGYLQSVPKFRMMRVPKLPPKYLTQQQMDKLLEHSSPYMKSILILMRNTGVRTEELLNLKFSDIDWSNKTTLYINIIYSINIIYNNI